ncbi:aldo/keto reductase [Rhodovulum sp. DZ06]|uniref:aldo/keto reductase n=1 Tax=Rhodovulum sp. DZ06 TaxID=3425126 RepID=UPI003D32F0BA
MKIIDAGDARIPALGYGTWRLEGDEARDMTAAAIGAGFRHVDTARMYKNEAAVGAGVRASGVARDALFVTTKIWPDDHAPDALRAAAEDSVATLGFEPDMILLHWPSKTVPLGETIPALCRLAADGLCAHVGVSNFTRAQVETVTALADRKLAVNQVEFHPYLDQSPMLDLLASKGMALTAYLPLARGEAPGDPVLQRIAAQHGATSAAVCLAWILARGAIAIPKTANRGRLEENLSAQELELTAAQVEEISALAKPDGRMVNMPEIAPDWD